MATLCTLRQSGAPPLILPRKHGQTTPVRHYIEQDGSPSWLSKPLSFTYKSTGHIKTRTLPFAPLHALHHPVTKLIPGLCRDHNAKHDYFRDCIRRREQERNNRRKDYSVMMLELTEQKVQDYERTTITKRSTATLRKPKPLRQDKPYHRTAGSSGRIPS
ncbi:hypothetical protein BGX29_011194, partial [Mortierella sp. GBA35]